MIAPYYGEFQAPGKIILLGEHAVVYGQPAIAVPFRAVQAIARSSSGRPGTGLHVQATDVGLRLHFQATPTITVDHPDPLTEATRLILQAVDAPPPDAHILLHSGIPMGGGFGSGAAISAVLMRAVLAALGRQLDAATLNDLVYQVEKLYHGTPSGVDNTTIVFDQPVYFIKDQPPQPFHIGGAFHFVIGYTGQPSSTKITVGAVRARYAAEAAARQAVAEIGVLAAQGRAAIEAGDVSRLASIMAANQDLLHGLGVSAPSLEALITAAQKAGAYAAKLSGGGGGGNMIALCAPERTSAVAAALSVAGAAQTWQMVVAPAGYNG
jgi:mevalonate kinase